MKKGFSSNLFYSHSVLQPQHLSPSCKSRSSHTRYPFTPLYILLVYGLFHLFLNESSVCATRSEGGENIKSRSFCIAALAPSPSLSTCLPASCGLSHRVAVISISISFQFHYGNTGAGCRRSEEHLPSATLGGERGEMRESTSAIKPNPSPD